MFDVFTEDDKAFQAEVRAFIDEHYTQDMRVRNDQSKNGYLTKDEIVGWQKALHAKGWFALNWPPEYGGATLTERQRYILRMEFARVKTPMTSPMGVGMVGHVIMAFGTDEQKRQHLPPILSSDVWWCQGYSEPGSGSDLASLAMKAEDKGDHYLLNGSKIWTTHAQWADWMFLLVRTGGGSIKQEGISFVLTPMDAPGIEVQSLPTLDGPRPDEQEINQVFFTDVKVPKENLVGKEGEGWTCAKYLLQFERGNAYAPDLRARLEKVVKIAGQEQRRGAPLTADPDFARKLADMAIQIDALDATERRIFSALSAGQPVGPASSMLKCAGSEAQQKITELALEAVGIYAQPFMRDTWADMPGGDGQTNEYRAGPDYAAPIAPYYFNYRKASIYAGSNEIQRNIMAKMVLGL